MTSSRTHQHHGMRMWHALWDRTMAPKALLQPALARYKGMVGAQNTIGRDSQLSDSSSMAASRPQHSAFSDSRPVIRFPGGRSARMPASSPLGGSPLQACFLICREPLLDPAPDGILSPPRPCRTLWYG